jgi:quercetin dioxygenase-like cupin family protein
MKYTLLHQNKTNKHMIVATLFCFLLLAAFAMKGQNYNPQEMAMVLSVDDMKEKWGPCAAFMGNGCNITVLHGNPEKPNTDILFRMDGNTSVPRHWHHSPERMVLISGKMQVNYDEQDSEIINSGDYAYGPAERPHTASCISDEPCVLFIAFEDPIDAMPFSED